MRDGVCYRQPKWERRISVIGSGLLPTPIVPNGGQVARSGDRRDETPTLHAWAAKGLLSKWQWPTPTVDGNHNRAGLSPTSGRAGGLNLRTAVSGALNAAWVDLLMGGPTGWTSLAPLPAESWARWLAGDWWGDGWEDGVPRLTNEKEHRIARLRLLGNGQVPQTAAVAWRLLTAQGIGQSYFLFCMPISRRQHEVTNPRSTRYRPGPAHGPARVGARRLRLRVAGA